MNMAASAPAVHTSVDCNVDIAHRGIIISHQLDVKVLDLHSAYFGHLIWEIILNSHCV